jgi:hypothetical protein
VFFDHSINLLVEYLNIVLLSCDDAVQLHCVAYLRLHCFYCSIQVPVFDSFHFVELRYFDYLFFQISHTHILDFSLHQIYQLVFFSQSLLSQNSILILKQLDATPQITNLRSCLPQRLRFVIQFSKNPGNNVIVLSYMFEHGLIIIKVEFLHQSFTCSLLASGRASP